MQNKGVLLKDAMKLKVYYQVVHRAISLILFSSTG